jgi:hypothetical protein
MTVDDFVNELLPILGSDADEIIVKLARLFRENAGPDEYRFVVEFNEMATREGLYPCRSFHDGRERYLPNTFPSRYADSRCPL